MLRRSVITAVIMASLSVFAQGQTAYTWDGSIDSDWSDPLNWTADSGYPGQSSDEDTVTIPSTLGNQPELNVSVTIKSLAMTDSGTDPVLTINGGDMEIACDSDDNFNVGAGCTLYVRKDHKLTFYLDSPSRDLTELVLNGNIILGGGGGTNEPKLVFEDGVYRTSGSGMILAGDNSILQGFDVDDSPYVLLVLGKNNKLHGAMQIAVGLLNNGTVDPNGQGGDSDDKTMYLTCAPKGGSGVWAVTGGTEGHPNELIVDALTNGAGDLAIGEYGKLTVRRHMSLQGSFNMAQHGTLSVASGILFDVHRFADLCDYEP